MHKRDPFGRHYVEHVMNGMLDKVPHNLSEAENAEEQLKENIKDVLSRLKGEKRNKENELSWLKSGANMTGNLPALSKTEVSNNIRESSNREQEIIENVEFLYARQLEQILQG